MIKIGKMFYKTLVLVGLIATIPNSVWAYAEDSTVVFKVSDSEGTVGEDMHISITNDTDVEFSNGKFYLHYNNEVLIYKGFELPPSSAIGIDDVSVINDEHGISYIVISIENVQNANVVFDFAVLTEGNPGVSLDVSELFDQNNEPVRFSVENGTITVNPIVTEPEITTTTEANSITTETPTTTTQSTEELSNNTTATVETEKSSDITTTTVETEKPSNNTTTTVDTEKPSNNTTTTVDTEKPSDNTTTTVETEKPSDITTTKVETEKPSDIATTTVKLDSNTNNNNSTTTAKNSASIGNNTTTKLAVTSSQSGSESPGTGDSFPALLFAVALGVSASIAVVTKKHNK